MLQIQETIDQYHYYPFLVSCLKNMFGTSWLNILKNTVPFPYNNGASLLASLQLGHYWLQPTIALAYWIKDVTFVLCFFDYSKAFDMVPHSILLQKLRSCNVNQHILRWLAHYLSNRSQYVCVNGASSNTLPVSSGVLRGPY